MCLPQGSIRGTVPSLEAMTGTTADGGENGGGTEIGKVKVGMEMAAEFTGTPGREWQAPGEFRRGGVETMTGIEPV